MDSTLIPSNFFVFQYVSKKIWHSKDYNICVRLTLFMSYGMQHTISWNLPRFGTSIFAIGLKLGKSPKMELNRGCTPDSVPPNIFYIMKTLFLEWAGVVFQCV